MAQLSRPFQIALVAVCLLAAIWLFALQGRSTSTSGSGASAPASTSAPSASTPAASATAHGKSTSTAAPGAKSAATPTHVYHGSAPGVEGLTRAIAKAHEAVAISQQNAKQLEGKSAQASNEAAPAQTSSTTAPAKASAPVTKGAVKTSTTAPSSTVHKGSSTPSPTPRATVPAGQRTVEADLAKGEVVVLLFWNPKGSDDLAVHREVQLLAKVDGRKLAVQEALPSEVASFGSITRGVQVYATPTILIVNKKGRATTLTGLQDAFSIEQAIDEARQS